MGASLLVGCSTCRANECVYHTDYLFLKKDRNNYILLTDYRALWAQEARRDNLYINDSATFTKSAFEPKYASQSYVELVQVFRPGSHIAQICEPALFPVKHILAVNIRGRSTQADDRATK